MTGPASLPLLRQRLKCEGLNLSPLASFSSTFAYCLSLLKKFSILPYIFVQSAHYTRDVEEHVFSDEIIRIRQLSLCLAVVAACSDHGCNDQSVSLVKISWSGSPVTEHIENPPVLVINDSLVVISFDDNRCHRTWGQ
ncbi:hypothetical protein AVEN_102535-1 [Araneus ventricosus]|uniref:Uncharacterized protein n=1 Tax=Araneus ventricosus TaxID=182803 RepID=A0A4Y2BK16_ARAVE|nr:hypothetical protein AVEN_102535-1 [Araneus ventricosus]